MIHRNGYNGPITFECDVCHDSIDTKTDDFRDALSFAKDSGWIVKKIEDNWFHFCTFTCQKEATRSNSPKLPKVHQMNRDDALAWLGLSTTASKDEIKLAYRRLINVCHPDHGGTTSLAQLLNEVYDILK